MQVLVGLAGVRAAKADCLDRSCRRQIRYLSAGDSLGGVFRKRLYLLAAVLWLVTRIATVVLTFGWILLFPEGHHLRDWLGYWSQWDTGWYLHISETGYFSTASTAFFPLYPALIEVLSGGGSEPVRLAVALIVNNLGALIGFIALAVLASQELGGEEAALRTLRMAAAYPFAIFYFAGYTDGLFFGLATTALLLARRGTWWPCAAAAFLAALARPTGLILLLPIAWEYSRRHRLAVSWPGVLAVVSAPAALSAYMAFLWIRFGDPLIFVRAESEVWHRQAALPWDTLANAFRHVLGGAPVGLFDLLPVLFFAALTVAGARRLPLSLTLYMVGLIAFSIISPERSNPDVLNSAARYMTAATPAFLVLGTWTEKRAWLDTGLVAGGFMLQALLAIAFLSGRGIH